MKKYKHIITGIIVAVIGGLIATSFISTADVSAIECSILPSSICDKAGQDSTNGSTDVKDSAVWELLRVVVNIMSAGVAILAIAGIVYGAVMYTSAGDNQEQVKKAKDIFRNVVIGILAFALMYGFLQWLIPGGVF